MERQTIAIILTPAYNLVFLFKVIVSFEMVIADSYNNLAEVLAAPKRRLA
jgi:hypothetical protein